MRFIFDFLFKNKNNSKKQPPVSSKKKNVVTDNTVQTEPVGKAEIEIWKPVVGYEGIYEVSSFGKVRSIDRYIKKSNGSNTFYMGKVKNPYVSYKHPVVTLCNNMKSQNTLVKNLVANAFLTRPSDESKYEVQFIDGNPLNVSASNLYYAPVTKNKTKAKSSKKKTAYKKVSNRMKLRKSGQKFTKISVSEERLIVELKKVGYTPTQIKKSTGRSISTIRRILRRNDGGLPPDDSAPMQLRIL